MYIFGPFGTFFCTSIFLLVSLLLNLVPLFVGVGVGIGNCTKISLGINPDINGDNHDHQKSNTQLLSRESEFSNCFEKNQISADNRQVFAGSFIKPDDSL
jgi:hypothetical protein